MTGLLERVAKGLAVTLQAMRGDVDVDDDDDLRRRPALTLVNEGPERAVCPAGTRGRI